MEPVIARAVLLQEQAETRELQASVVAEEPLEIRINGDPYAVIMRTPGHETELAAGFCFTEGIVDSFAQICSIGFCPEAAAGMQNIVNVIVSRGCAGQGGPSEATARSPRAMVSRSSCGLCGVEMLADVEKKVAPLPGGLLIAGGELYRMLGRMIELQEIYASTRAAHAAGLFYLEGEPLAVREDVGRHNALDKAIGHGLMRGLDFSRCVAVLSSRISFEMVQKALRARIPVVAAVSAATSLAVDLAGRCGCTLVGRVREHSMVIYTHPERVIP